MSSLYAYPLFAILLALLALTVMKIRADWIAQHPERKYRPRRNRSRKRTE
ncbi:hypothetical protein ACFO0A_00675 [Novosphingobium tardum]|uniref:Heme exporter protein D n=1 Tax=Novosphingobium tardum TaxID=1538021 RepID=A0ABV8RJV3_9SPHN